MTEQLYAKWEEVEQCVRDAVESVLTDYDPADGSVSDWHMAWVHQTVAKIADVVTMHLDGYTAHDIADEDLPADGARSFVCFVQPTSVREGLSNPLTAGWVVAGSYSAAAQIFTNEVDTARPIRVVPVGGGRTFGRGPLRMASDEEGS